MPTNRVHVRYNETYDLSTKADSLGLIAVHTPSTIALKSKFEGLFKQFKFIRFNSVSLRCACASLMPIDPLQVGLEAGQVAPQDMFNPILYTAVSNESMGVLLDRIYSFQSFSNGADVSTTAGPSLNWVDAVPGVSNPFAAYYGLLSGEKFRTAMPQQGFEMHNVVPLAHKVVTNVPLQGTLKAEGGNAQQISGGIGANNVGHDLGVEQGSIAGNKFLVPIEGYSNGTVPLPRIPTMVAVDIGAYAINEPTPVYCMACILPPAKLQRLFFRMVISWSITFEEFRPLEECSNTTYLAQVGSQFYKSDYEEQSASMTSTTAVIDGMGMDVELVTTSVS